MANKDKIIKVRERVYREIAKNPGDLFSLRATLLKQNIVESGNKFDRAIEMLKESGRIYVKAGQVALSKGALKMGTLVFRGQSGYVMLDGDGRQYQVETKSLTGYNSHDRVMVGFNENNDRKTPFVVSKIEEENQTPNANLILGRVAKLGHDQLIFIPSDKRFTKNIAILNTKSTVAQYQDKICLLELTQDEKNGLPAFGVIKEIVGDAGNPIHEYDAIASQHGANMTWSDEIVEKEIEKLPNEVDLSGYTLTDEEGTVVKEGGDERLVDLRELDFTTVDPATCKDMDDAIYSTYNEDGDLVVYTAVANVPKYVDLESEIGKRYIRGGFTIYAPNKAYNILPPQLSTNICSLNPDVDRLAMVVKSVIDEKTGEVKSSSIYDAVIKSKRKLSYEEAQKITDECKTKLKEKIFAGKPLSIDEQVAFNSYASQVLWEGLNKRNLIKFETNDEYNVIFNSDFSDIVDILPEEDVPYHKVIEAFMLTANEATAQFAKRNNVPNIYRVHDMPNEDKVNMAEEFFKILGIDFKGDLSPEGIKEIIDSVKGTKQEKVVNNFLVRLQSKAKYNTNTNPKKVEYVRLRPRVAGNKKGNNIATVPWEKDDNISHFGLQSVAYSHSTSPIRRITDYVTMNNILAYINGKELLSEDKVFDICGIANILQDENKDAEREFNEVNSVIYCENNIGKIMKGKVCAFKHNLSGEIVAVVENEEKGVTVNIPVSSLCSNNSAYLSISPYGSAVFGKNKSHPVVKLCDELTFKICSADRVTREVNATTDLQREIIADEEKLEENGIKMPQKPQKTTKKRSSAYEYYKTYVENQDYENDWR